MFSQILIVIALLLLPMITLRRDRISIFGFIVIVVILFTWKTDIFSSDILTSYKSVVPANVDNKPPPENVEPPQDLKKSGEGGNPKKKRRLAYTSLSLGNHAHGFTLLDNLYLRNGTFYVITPDQSKFLPRRNMISRPLKMDAPMSEPTDNELKYLTRDNTEVLGNYTIRVEGLSVIIYDPPEFMKHLYHWWGEIILGMQRVLAHEGTKRKLTLTPTRFILPFVSNGEFRDHAGLDMPLMRAAFPQASLEESGYWEDYKSIDATVVFERVMLINRPAAHRSWFANKWPKMIAGTMNLDVADNFWAPIRQATVQNILGYVPEPEKRQVHDAAGELVPMPKPLVTYISRQGGRRSLRAEDHEALVEALKALEGEGLCEFREAHMELLSLREQVELAARSTIIIGVHGNGLTHQLWMPSSPRSSVFEIFYPKGYIFDYEIVARNVGHKHYAVWNDTLVTYPKGTSREEGVEYGDPNNFHGNEIPVHPEAVITAMKRRLSRDL